MPGRIIPNLQSPLALVLEPSSVLCSLSSIPKGPNMTCLKAPLSVCCSAEDPSCVGHPWLWQEMSGERDTWQFHALHARARNSAKSEVGGCSDAQLHAKFAKSCLDLGDFSVAGGRQSVIPALALTNLADRAAIGETSVTSLRT